MYYSITCTRRLEFDSAHRVALHESKCKHVHGHRYAAEVTFQAQQLDKLGRVIDFGLVKERLGEWIDTHWDHTLILWDQDRPLGESVAAHTGQAVYYLPYNPTAENMARYLLEHICPTLFNESGLACVRVTIQETPNCRAEATVQG